MSEWGEGMYGVDPWREKASWIHGGKNDGPDLRREKDYPDPCREKAKRIQGGKMLKGSMEGKRLGGSTETGGKQELQSRRG